MEQLRNMLYHLFENLIKRSTTNYFNVAMKIKLEKSRFYVLIFSNDTQLYS
jgi:hypothetical protein